METDDKKILDLKQKKANLYAAVFISCKKPSNSDVLSCVFQHNLENIDFSDKNSSFTNDQFLLEHIESEIKHKIELANIDYSNYDSANDQTITALTSILSTDFVNPTVGIRMRIHEKSKYMLEIRLIIAYKLLSLEALKHDQYLLALEHHELASYYFNSVSEKVSTPTPFQHHTEQIKTKACDLALEIWKKDTDNILLRKNVAELVVDLLAHKGLSSSQVSNWFKQEDIVPDEIKKRTQNRDYGNDKPTVIARKKLMNEIRGMKN